MMLRAECQSARMLKITNDGSTRSGTGCFIAVSTWQQWAIIGNQSYPLIIPFELVVNDVRV